MFSRHAILMFCALLILVCCPVAKDLPRESGGCFSIVVGRAASIDGSVIMAHNEDDYIPQVVNHHKVARQKHAPGETVAIDNGETLEQVPETWSYIWSEMPGLLFSDSYLNEWGVCVCSDACPSREDSAQLTDGGITHMLRQIVAERAKSAREGVHIAASLVERFGYGASGRTYIISDSHEGWFFCAVNGKRWVAERVPDNQVAMIANSYVVHQIDLTDTVNYFGSPDIISYAISRGWYNPQADGKFDFAEAYADPETAVDPRNTGRQWDGLRHVAASVPAYDQPLPFSVPPQDKISARFVMSVLRSHYEESKLSATDSATGCPHSNSVTPICRHDTQTSFVAQLRGFMPPELGLVYWVSLSSPCASSYIPFYFGLDSFPSSYEGVSVQPSEDDYAARIAKPFAVDETNAFWTFTTLRHRVENQYTGLAPKVRGLLDEVEMTALDRQSAIDAQALDIFLRDREEASLFTSSFTSEVIASAMTKLRQVQAAQ